VNALKGVEHKKIGVTGNEMSRMAAHGEFEKLVVLRITACPYLDVHVDPLSLAREGSQKAANIFLINILAEPFSGQNLVELGKCGKRQQ